MQFSVSLATIADVKDFVTACSGVHFNVDVGSGKYIVDGKSLMGVFSLDLSVPVAVECAGYDKADNKKPYEDFKRNIQHLIVK